MEIRIGRRRKPPRDLRLEMINETSRFLSWALSEDRELPRIPTVPVDKGGYERLMKLPGAKRITTKWWKRAIDRISG